MFVEVETIIDVEMELRFVDNEGPTAGDVPAGAALGKLYYDYLDGIVSHQLVPFGTVNILP
jgi:hypothetical protein